MKRNRRQQEIPATQLATLTPTAIARGEPLLYATIWWCHQVYFPFKAPNPRPHLWQIPNVIGVEQQLLEAPRIPLPELLGHVGQRAMSLIHELDLPIASLEDWNALEHCWFAINYTTAADSTSLCTILGLFCFRFDLISLSTREDPLRGWAFNLALHSSPAFYIFSHTIWFPIGFSTSLIYLLSWFTVDKTVSLTRERGNTQDILTSRSLRCFSTIEWHWKKKKTQN